MNDSGVKKAALLPLALGTDEAADALRHLEPREIQKISAAMAAVKKVGREDMSNAVRDFIQGAATHSALSLGADAYLRSVLNSVFGDDKAASVVERILVGDPVEGAGSV